MGLRSNEPQEKWDITVYLYRSIYIRCRLGHNGANRGETWPRRGETVDTPASHQDQSAWIVAHHVTSLTCRGHTVATSACSVATMGCSGVIWHIKRGYTVSTPGIWNHKIISDKKMEISHDSPQSPTNYSPGDTGVKIGTVGL